MTDTNVVDINATIKAKDLRSFLAEQYADPSVETLDLSEFINDGELAKLNETHAYVQDHAGSPSILEHAIDAHGRPVDKFWNASAFMMNHAHIKVGMIPGKPGIPLGKAWLEWNGKRTYQGVIFDPSLPREHNGYYNTYRGFAIEPKRGSWKRMRKHMWEIASNKDKTKFEYLLKWLAYTVQFPATPPGVAIVLKGKEGAGKGIIFTEMTKIFGDHGYHISSMDRLTGRFTYQLTQTVFLFCDEALVPGESAGPLKRIITEDTIVAEPKNKESFESKNCLHIGMATNENWIAPISLDSRRFYINLVDDTYCPHGGPNSIKVCEKYFNALWEETRTGGTEAMLYDLLRIDLTGWSPIFSLPRTSEFLNQQDLSREHPEKAILLMLENGELPSGSIKRRGDQPKVSVRELKALLEIQTPKVRSMSDRKLADMLKKYGGLKHRTPTGVVWELPHLKDMRKAWCKVNRMTVEQAFREDPDAQWLSPTASF